MEDLPVTPHDHDLDGLLGRLDLVGRNGRPAGHDSVLDVLRIGLVHRRSASAGRGDRRRERVGHPTGSGLGAERRSSEGVRGRDRSRRRGGGSGSGGLGGGNRLVGGGVRGVDRAGRADLDDDLGVAELDLVTALELGLVDLLAVDDRPRRRPEVDDEDLVRPRDLDHRMHPRHAVVVDAQVARGVDADLDDLLRQLFRPDELVALVDPERHRDVAAHLRLQWSDPVIRIGWARVVPAPFCP